MSSDERIKKLRGSGGYVIARVTDEEQVKGNLGGPDLFLSPIGRLDPGAMSKYYCNKCEREFEGGPRIDYESPNEEVAENLILAEKGQYACHNCSATIAEYRIFSKPDENAEVGAAKPEAEIVAPTQPQQAPPEPPVQQQQPPPQQQAPPEPPAQQHAHAQQEAPAGGGGGGGCCGSASEPPAEQREPRVEAPAGGGGGGCCGSASEPPAEQEEECQPEPVRPIAGMSVFDDDGNVVGTAREVGVSKSRGIVLVVQAPDGKEAAIRWDMIGKVGEIILLKACGDGCCSEQPSGEGCCSEQPSGASGACVACGFSNSAGAKFCEQCGARA